MARTVFILGAGASVSSGAPLLKDFFFAIEDLHRTGDVGGLRKDFSLFLRGTREIQRFHAKARVADPKNIETILSLFELAEQTGQLGEEIDSGLIRELVPSARRVIARVLERRVGFVRHPETGVRAEASYANFATLVSERAEKDGEPPAVLTFNYDLGVDVAMQREFEGGHVHYGLKEPLIDPEFTFPLLRLHGSIAWSECAVCGVVDPIDVGTLVYEKRREPTHGGAPPPRLEVIHRHEGRACPKCDAIAESISPAIVPPTVNKLRYQSGLVDVWRAAVQALRNAENVVVIGYSLPPTDLFFRHLYALGVASATSIRRFIVCDPDATGEVAGRFQALLGPEVYDRFAWIEKPMTTGLDEVRKRLNR